VSTQQLPEVTERLAEPEFDEVFGRRVAQSIGFNERGLCVVNSALTRRLYVWWDWQAGRYVAEPR
jgi:hypothetical protein